MKEKNTGGINVDKMTSRILRFFDGNEKTAKSFINGLLADDPEIDKGEIFRRASTGNGVDRFAARGKDAGKIKKGHYNK